MYRQHFGLRHAPLDKDCTELWDDGALARLAERFQWLLTSPGIGLLTGVALDAYYGSGVRGDDEHDALAAEFVRDFEVTAGPRDGAVTTHQSGNTMQEQFIELSGKWSKKADAWQVLLIPSERSLTSERGMGSTMVNLLDPRPEPGVEIGEIANVGRVQFSEKLLA